MLSSLLGSKPAAPAPREPVPSPAGDVLTARKESGLVLDALGAVLQHYGRHAFDLSGKSADEVRLLVTSWALHATLGAPRPGQEESDRCGVSILDRDWKGLVNSFGTLRREERESVVTSHDDLKSVVKAFVTTAHGLAVEEDAAERATTAVLDRVQAATSSNDRETLKREALAAIDVINALMRSRREHQREQFAMLAEKLQTLGDELEVAKSESMSDPLTNLSNRKAFDLHLARSVELHALHRNPTCLMLVDVDHFKSVNDAYGHQAGDAILRQVAQGLARTFLRRCDVVSRYGGDEFAVILGETEPSAAEQLAHRLRRAVDLVNEAVPEMPLPPTLSIGITALVLGDDCETWFKRADQALYSAKEGGRDRVAIGEVVPAV